MFFLGNMLVAIECCVFVGFKTVEGHVINFFCPFFDLSFMCNLYILTARVLEESDMRMYQCQQSLVPFCDF